jgi:thioredoxin 1
LRSYDPRQDGSKSFENREGLQRRSHYHLPIVSGTQVRRTLPLFHGPYRQSNPSHQNGVKTMNLNRRAVLAGVALSFLTVSGTQAANKVQFDAAAFKAARASGKPVVLEVAATWCGPCQKMKRTVSELVERPDFKDVTIFEADYDANKEELQEINAYHLTMLVLYRDKSEVQRMVGETRSEVIEPLLRKAM